MLKQTSNERNVLPSHCPELKCQQVMQFWLSAAVHTHLERSREQKEVDFFLNKQQKSPWKKRKS